MEDQKASARAGIPLATVANLMTATSHPLPDKRSERMYEELGSVKEPVKLSLVEALSSARVILNWLGYRIVQQTDVMVIGERRKRSGLLGKTALYVAVVARPLPEGGGVQITLRGDDREGIKERQADWSRWAEELPKVEAEHPEDERAGTGTASRQTAQLQSEAAGTRMRDDLRAERPLRIDEPPDARGVQESRVQEGRTEIASESEEVTGQVREPSAWTSAAPWSRKQRVAPGKLGDELDEVGETFDTSALGSDLSRGDPDIPQGDGPQEDVADRDAAEVESGWSSGDERGRVQGLSRGDLSDLIERVEAFENRLGVRLEGLFAKIEDDEIRVNGELHSQEGTELKQDLEVVVTAYDSSGRVIYVEDARFYANSFFGFEAFSVSLYLEDVRPARIRVYPKAV